MGRITEGDATSANRGWKMASWRDTGVPELGLTLAAAAIAVLLVTIGMDLANRANDKRILVEKIEKCVTMDDDTTAVYAVDHDGQLLDIILCPSGLK